MIERLLEKQNLSRREKLAFFRSMLKREMDVMNEYCAMNLPPEYRAELCHIENIKKAQHSPATSGNRVLRPRFYQDSCHYRPKAQNLHRILL